MYNGIRVDEELKPVFWMGSSLYVLHAFRKKSKSGIATPTAEIALIRQRFAAAQQDYERRKS
jgi:phage-related protein